MPCGCCSTTPTLDVGAHLAIVGEDPPLLTAREIPTLVDKRGAFPLSYRSVVLRGMSRPPRSRRRPAGIRGAAGRGSSRPGFGSPIWTPISTPTSGRRLPRWWPNSLRSTTSRRSAPRVSHRALPVGFGVNLLSRRLRTGSDLAGLATTDTYTGLDEAGSFDQARFERSLGGSAGRHDHRDTVEINTHPGEQGDPDLARFGWGYHWADELAMLCSPATRAAIERERLPAGWLPGPGAADDRCRATAAPTMDDSTMSTVVRFPRRPTGAGRAALRAYRLLPIGARLHATVRWWSAPFAAVQAEVPPTGRILEIGCGHGLLCTYLALSQPARSVLGVDIDPGQDRPGVGRWQRRCRTWTWLSPSPGRGGCRTGHGTPSWSSTCCTCCPRRSSANC